MPSITKNSCFSSSAVCLPSLKQECWTFQSILYSNLLILMGIFFQFIQQNIRIHYLYWCLFCKDRWIVVRQPNGTLRKAHWNERDRMNFLFHQRDGQSYKLPSVLENEHLKVVRISEIVVWFLISISFFFSSLNSFTECIWQIGTCGHSWSCVCPMWGWLIWLYKGVFFENMVTDLVMYICQFWLKLCICFKSRFINIHMKICIRSKHMIYYDLQDILVEWFTTLQNTRD